MEKLLSKQLQSKTHDASHLSTQHTKIVALAVVATQLFFASTQLPPF